LTLCPRKRNIPVHPFTALPILRLKSQTRPSADGMSSFAALGFRIKSGWATAVLLEEGRGSVHVVDRRQVELCDPARPELRQPYHADFGVESTDDETVTERVRAIERDSDRSLSVLLDVYRKAGRMVCGAALVVGSDIDPDRIANQHIRAHAREGRLFRRVVEEALRREGLKCSIWVERELYAAAAQQLGRSEEQVRREASGLGRAIAGGGWRSDDKVSAVAAWLTLAMSRDPGRSQ
jgi:hypothetical protein